MEKIPYVGRKIFTRKEWRKFKRQYPSYLQYVSGIYKNYYGFHHDRICYTVYFDD